MLTLSDNSEDVDVISSVLPEVVISSVLPEVKYDDNPTNIYPYCFKNFISKNKPFILKSCSQDWKSTSNWVLNEKPNTEYLARTYEDVKVPVANCNAYYFNAHEKSDMSVSEYMAYWQSYIEGNYAESQPCYYLKDWHFTRDFKTESIYRVPNVFASDWLNEYYSEHLGHKDDYRFVYMGPRNTWTPLHADVFHSYSWSVNICGKKQWLLLAPGNEKYFKDSFGNLVSDMKSVDWSLIPVDTVVTIEQEAGDGIFVPSGWHHQVTNVEDTISVNHNWINGTNIKHVFEELVSHLEAVKKEIDDCKTMDDWGLHCQLMLKVSFGMNFKQFFDMLKFICKKRLDSLKNGTEIQLYGDWTLSPEHAVFDLKNASDVLEQSMNHEDWDCSLETNRLIEEIALVI